MERIPLHTAISRNVTSNNQQITCFAYLVKRQQALAWSKLHWLSSIRKIFLKWQKWQFLEILQDSSRAKWLILSIYYKRAKMTENSLRYIDSTPFKIIVMQKTVWRQKSYIRKREQNFNSVENGHFGAFCKDSNSRAKSSYRLILKMNFKTAKTTEEENVGVFAAKCAGASGIVIIVFMT